MASRHIGLGRKDSLKEIRAAIGRVNNEIAAHASGNFYGAGLASEGYAGGYRDALFDVVNVFNGIQPERRNYWDDWSTEEKD